MITAGPSTGFTPLDWLVVAGYILLVAWLGIYLSRRGAASASDYFLAGGTMPASLICFSVLATTQSAATFLGGPDSGYAGDLTYVATGLAAILASLIVGLVLLPRYYAIGAQTAYDFLETYFGVAATRTAGGFYLVGRVLANGARLYLAALAVAMILFQSAAWGEIVVACAGISVVALAFTIVGGLRSVVASDAFQFAIYTSTALALLVFLYFAIDMTPGEVVTSLRNGPGGVDKTVIFDTSFRMDDPFTLPAILTGIVLLNVANFGMDQDTTQRLLSARSSRHATGALVWAGILTIPIVFVFVMIGQLLWLFYQQNPQPVGDLASETVFMTFILTELPAGFRGLATTGVLAAAVSTLNSSYNSMSSVIVGDFYRPLVPGRSERHYLGIARIVMVLVAIALFAMAVLCIEWQRSSDMPLLAFALQIMIFAYSGLLGAFGVAILTKRGSTASVITAMFIGFGVTALLEPAIGQPLGIPAGLVGLAFPWKICIGAIIAFLVAAMGNNRRPVEPVPAARQR